MSLERLKAKTQVYHYLRRFICWKELLNEKKAALNQSAWSGFLVKCKRMWPFVWPSNNCRLQLHVIACVIILVASRAVNVLIPVLQKFIGKWVKSFNWPCSFLTL